MALGLSFADGTPASMARGRYITRNGRLVEISGSRIITENVAGETRSKTVWDGTLFKGDQKNPETQATWSNEAGYLHLQGVGNGFDLTSVISQETAVEAQPLAQTDPAVLESQILCAALTARLAEESEGPEEKALDTLNRVISERNLFRKKFKATQSAT